MATTVTKTIGPSGADYTTLQAWFDAAPASLVTADQIWQGKILSTFADNNTSGTTTLVMSGKTVDATRYFELTTNAGASWRDDASVQSHAFRYGTNAGCTIATSGLTTTGIRVDQDYTRISNLQFSMLGPAISLGIASGATNCDINNCLIEADAAGNGVIRMYGSGNKIRNSLIVQRHSAASVIAELQNGSEAYNCTFAVPSDLTAASFGLLGAYAAATVKNCAIFGASALSSGTAPTMTTCASDLAAGTGHIQVTYSSAFENTADATRDFRVKAGSGLINAGTTDSTNAATDAAGTARPSGAAYDIGAWEYVAAGGGSHLFRSSPGGSLSGLGSSGPFFQNPLQ